jgi:hypothetical protein
MSAHIELSGTEKDELIRLRNQRSSLIKENKALTVNLEEFKSRALLAESQLSPTRDALNKLTAEKSKWLRKNKS